MSALPIVNSSLPHLPPTEGEALKPSEYNVFVEAPEDDTVWVCNTRSGAFARLDVEQFRLAQRLLDGEAPEGDAAQSLFDGLTRGQFLIPDDLDELKLLKVRNQMARYAGSGLGLIIAPTLRCNFNCPYCYVDLNANKMPQDARERVKKFFSKKLEEDSRASLCWTGGDPSLAMGVVDDLSQHFIKVCEERNCEFDAVMITNGYLLDRKMLDTVKRSRIAALQITFDGDKEFHDGTRALAGGRPTFDRILDNIVGACEEITINVRVNVDGRNWRSIPKLLQTLADRGLGNTKVAVYYAHVQPINDLAKDHEESCLTVADYADLEPELIRLAMDLGFRQSNAPLQRQISTFCGANSTHHYVIDAKAKLQKCYDDLGHADTQGIGYIDEDGSEVIDKHHNLLHWISWDPFEFDECRSCKVLPMCMGGCSYHVIRNKEGIGPGCLKLRYNLEQIIRLYGERLSGRRTGEFAKAGCLDSGGCSSL